jgi:hypothetical protein
MNKILELVNSVCNALTGWFDNTLRALLELTTQVANVAIRVLIAYGLYALVVKDLLLRVVEAL